MNAMDFLRGAAVAVLLVALAACQTTGRERGPQDRREARLEVVESTAGAPVDRFRFWQLRRFEVLGDHEVLIWTEVNEAYLLYLEKPCLNLIYAGAIGLTSTNRIVSRRFDKVSFDDQQCLIRQIRPVDTDELEAAGRRTGIY